LHEKNGMKRILYLSRGGCIGGSHRQLYYVVANLDHGLEPVVVCNKNGQFVDQLRQSGITTSVIPLHPWRKFPAGLLRYIDAERLVRFARQHNIALVHSSDLWLSNYMNCVSARLKIPSVLHVRTPLTSDSIHKHHCNKATAIIAISRRIKQNLIDAGISPEKIIQIDDAVDTDAFSPKPEQVNVLKQQFPVDGRILVGIVGRIDPFKRQLDFLNAAEQIVRNSTKNVAFFLIGETHSESYFRKTREFTAKHQLDKYVFFTGRRDDMPQILSSLDILVSLSGGSVMFEAMACGRPVVSAGFSTKENSVHIQDGITGLLISSEKTPDLAEAMMRLINSAELRNKIGRNARSWAKSSLSHTDMVAKTQQLYQKLLANG